MTEALADKDNDDEDNGAAVSSDCCWRKGYILIEMVVKSEWISSSGKCWCCCSAAAIASEYNFNKRPRVNDMPLTLSSSTPTKSTNYLVNADSKVCIGASSRWHRLPFFL